MIDDQQLAALLLRFLRDGGAMALVEVDASHRISRVDGAWRELLGEPSSPVGVLLEERIGGVEAGLIAEGGVGWSVMSAVWRPPTLKWRAVELRVSAVGSERLLLLTAGVWTEDRGLFELSKLHEQLTNAERALHRRNRELEEARAHLARLAARDPLTGLGNRRLLDETLERATSYSRRHGQSLCVVTVDLDHFKSVNDQHGHAVGDRVLVAFSRLLDAATRCEDVAARAGGEEFVLVLPGTPLAGGRVVAERLRERTEALDLGLPAPVTASFGLAEYRAGDTPSSLLQRADEALYAAKRAGRNRVEVAK